MQHDLDVFRYMSYTAAASAEDAAKFRLTGAVAKSKGEDEAFQAPANLERVEILGVDAAVAAVAADRLSASSQWVATLKRRPQATAQPAAYSVPVHYAAESGRLVLDLSAAQLGAGDAFEIEWALVQA